MVESLLTKIGEKFDSSITNLTYYHSHNEKKNSLKSSQFLYKSIADHRSNLQPKIYGNCESKPHNTQIYILRNDERISKVRGHITNTCEVQRDKSEYQGTWIRGMEFLRRKGRIFLSYTEEEEGDESFSEEYDGHTFGYIAGKSNEHVDQLTFFWHRTETHK